MKTSLFTLGGRWGRRTHVQQQDSIQNEKRIGALTSTRNPRSVASLNYCGGGSVVRFPFPSPPEATAVATLAAPSSDVSDRAPA